VEAGGVAGHRGHRIRHAGVADDTTDRSDAQGERMPLAYLDANSGSLIATVLVGGTAAAGVAVRAARSRVTGVFSRRRTGEADTAADADVVPDAVTTQGESEHPAPAPPEA
jgi:hypothetical protein